MSSQIKFLELNQYLILNQIGSGAFGKVYLIKDKNMNQKYAAKVSIFMVDENTEDKSETPALFREINLLSMLDHSAILNFIGYSQVAFNGDLTPTIITEYACNGSLYDLLQMEKSGLSIDGWHATKKLIIVYGIACGMSYYHQISSSQIIGANLQKT